LYGGGFNPRESFVGELSHLYVIPRALSQSEVMSMSQFFPECVEPHRDILKDAVVKWADVLDGIRGNVMLRNSSLCAGE
jgi:hypothetical protein